MPESIASSRPLVSAPMAYKSPQIDGYYWPVWKFGRILEASDARGLTVSQAVRVGSLFEPEGAAAKRYFGERMEMLHRSAEDCGAEVIQATDTSPQESARFDSLARRLPDASRKGADEKSSATRVTYQFVPVVRFPRYFIRLGPVTWLAREVITVCGNPSKSKVWLALSLFLNGDSSTEEKPIPRQELTGIRADLGRFKTAALDSLVEYYNRVLLEDAAPLDASIPDAVGSLQILNEAEIMGVLVDQPLEEALDLLEEFGYRKFMDDILPSDGSRLKAVSDFMTWASNLHKPLGRSVWTRGKPKIVEVYPDWARFDSHRSLVVPMSPDDDRRVWYGTVTERGGEYKKILFSENVAAFLAQEYGRCH